ncbi:MAG: RBBP9/YdeN family alpha/beta hydrolase [Hyphomicrobiaceae bacterium]
MRTADVDILLCVERHALDADHWAMRWSRNLKTGQVIDVTGRYSDTLGVEDCPLARGVASARRPILLVGYHLGVIAIVKRAQQFESGRVRGAFLVAPPDVALVDAGQGGSPSEHRGKLSNEALPFPSLMIASRSDPRCGYDKASELALSWGSHLVDAGDIGQIDLSSGHGPWPEGLMRLGWFLKRL